MLMRNHVCLLLYQLSYSPGGGRSVDSNHENILLLS